MLEAHHDVSFNLLDAKDVTKTIKSISWADAFLNMPKVDHLTKCVYLGPEMLVRFRVKPAFIEFLGEFLGEK